MTFVLFPQFYASWFRNEDNAVLWAQVENLVPSILMIAGLYTLFDSAYFNISFSLKGAGDTRYVSLVALILPWPLMVLPAWLVRNHENAVLLAWGFAALYAIVTTAILVLRFRQGKWQHMSVIHPAG